MEVPTVTPADPPKHHVLSLCVVKDSVNPNNSLLSLHDMSDMVRLQLESCEGTVHVICCVEDEFPCRPLRNTIGRAFPCLIESLPVGICQIMRMVVVW